MPKVAIITPATGREELRGCLLSVQRQQFKDLEHVVVIDGKQRSSDVYRRIAEANSSARVIELPDATGVDGFRGHRVYGAIPYIVNTEWILFLDEDNWIDPNHVVSLINLAQKYRLQWAYSLRKIFSSRSTFVCLDNCNSLGWWPSFDGGYHHVDTNCYMLRTEIAIQTSHMWHRRSVDPDIETADRALCIKLLKEYPYAFTTGQYTLNYRIGSRISEARSRAFYTKGNAIISSLYRKLPWVELQPAGRLLRHPCLSWEIHRKTPSLASIYQDIQTHVSPSKQMPAYNRESGAVPRPEHIQVRPRLTGGVTSLNGVLNKVSKTNAKKPKVA